MAASIDDYHMFLNTVSPGSRVCVTAVEGGHGIRQNLALRGIAEGAVITVLSSSHGPVVVCVQGGTLALGRGMAAKVRVRRMEP